MSLFQTSVVKKYLNDLSPELIDKKFTEFQAYFGNKEQQERIRNLKEEQFQEGFLRELFVKILDYTINPDSNFNLTTEIKNVDDSKKADGAILKDNTVSAVIELKSTQTTDLDTVETQAFNYKNHHPKCQYVITSNFEKLRFYIQNAVQHSEFDLFNLTREDFALLWLCLHKDNVLSDIPLKMKETSVLQEENVTKKLYNDYSTFRKEIFNNIVKNNPEYDKLVLFKKTQKLLDRFLFIFFAEDRLLVPPNSINQIVEKWKDDVDFGDVKPLYSIFKQYFHVLNVGRPKSGKRQEIFAYNGGLFLADEILDNIKIDDDILHKHTLQLSTYDFETEVDVNILGHIFEHSLGEIENVQAEIKGEEVDKQKTRRKKDGIFYTPKYITKYIVENTVGKLCEEKRKELEIVDEEYAKGRKNRKKDLIRKLDDKLNEYRNWLLDITILDPACGSGAFLNQALEFLIQEHRKIDELRFQLLGGSIVFPDIEDKILEKNIYGVDLNEESVEIAKLSLWLRTARKGRKLTTLSNHIKCGNSLIDDPETAGEKAFNWQNEFPEIFAKGGFDVVIGNPPYVRMQNIDLKSREFYNTKYKVAYKNYDLYILFTERIKLLIKDDGIASYIMPKKFITTEYGERLKQFLYNQNLLDCFVDFGDYQVFQDATTYTGIFIFTKILKQVFSYKKVDSDLQLLIDKTNFSEIKYSNLSDKNWILLDKNSSNLFNKLSKLKKLKDLSSTLYVGLQTSADPVFILEIKGDHLYSKFTKKLYKFNSTEIIKPLLKGAEIKRYSTPIPNFKLIFPYYLEDDSFELIPQSDMENKFSDIWNYLKECKEKLENRENGKMKNDRWYGYVYLKNMTEFSKPKILTQVLCKSSSLTLDLDKQFYFVGGGTAGGYGIRLSNEINEFTLLAILNSNLAQWFIQKIASPFQGGYYAYNKSTLGEVPIPETIKNLESITTYVKSIIAINDRINELKSQFVRYMQNQVNSEYLDVKIQNWNNLSFQDFIKLVNKAQIKMNGMKLTKSDELEWMEVFESKKNEIKISKAEADKIDKEINQLVYALYGLTEEEIKIIENN